MTEQLPESTFDTGDVVLNYAHGPARGTPLVLLHGGSARWQYFGAIIPDLAREWQVYAVDLRGHGHSGRVPSGYALRNYAADICAFLDGVSGPAAVLGHSLGGIVAVMAAAACPERVRALIVGDSPLSGDTWSQAMAGQHAQQQSWRALAGGRLTVDQIVAALKDSPVAREGDAQPRLMREIYGEEHPVYAWLGNNLFRLDPDVLGMILDDFSNTSAGFDREILLPAIPCPVLLLQADPAAGAALSDAEVARALQLLPQPRHVRIPGVSHTLWVDQKEPVLRAIQDFLRAAL